MDMDSLTILYKNEKKCPSFLIPGSFTLHFSLLLSMIVMLVTELVHLSPIPVHRTKLN